MTYRAARRILERVSWTRQTSRLLRRPYSPTSFNSESLYYRKFPSCQFFFSDHNDMKDEHARFQWPGDTDSRAASKGRRGTLAVLEYERGAMLATAQRISMVVVVVVGAVVVKGS